MSGQPAFGSLPALVALAVAGCASSSTRGDFETVNALVEQRAELRLIERDPERFESQEPEVARLLAQPLTVDAALKIAVLNNRDLRASMRDLGVARGELVQAGLLPNPELEAEVRFPESGEGDPTWELGVGFDLTRALLAPARADVAEAELEAARFRVAGAVLDFTYRVRLAFYEVQARQQKLELQNTALDALTASFEAARALHEAGNLTSLDLVSEQAAYEQARVAAAEAEADLLDARERLNVLLGLFGENTAWRVEARLADPAEQAEIDERLEARAIETSIELAEARASLAAHARRAGLSETSGWLPDLTVGVAAEREDDAWQIGPRVSGTLPVFDRQQGRTQSLTSEFHAARERYVATAIGIRAAARSVRNRLRSAQERARHYRTVILPLRERVVAETLLQYNAMQVGVFQLLQARRDQLAAASAYLETLREYWQARAAFDQLLSGRLAGTMEPIASGPARVSAPASEPTERH